MAFGSRSGSWWFKSESDPRFEAEGISSFLSTWEPPKEAQEKLKELEERYGKAPEDLEWGFMKD